MLYIQTTLGAKTWAIGESRHLINVLADQVISIKATEEELHFIIANFNVPFALHKDIVNWYGDTAKFIVGNL